MESKSIYPEYFARFYDVIYDQMRSGSDYQFYQDQIAKVNGKILEVGVGTGRFFMDALKNGNDIYGIDISPEMIEVLYEKLDQPKDRKRVWEADITQMKLPDKYELIIAPFRVLMHLTTIDEQLTALNNVAAHLSHNGIFIFDAFVPNFKMLLKGLKGQIDFDGEYKANHKLIRSVTMTADLVNQLMSIFFKFKWQEDGQWHEQEWQTKMHFFLKNELELLIRQSDLRLDKIIGDFEGKPLLPDSKEFIVFCKHS